MIDWLSWTPKKSRAPQPTDPQNLQNRSFEGFVGFMEERAEEIVTAEVCPHCGGGGLCDCPSCGRFVARIEWAGGDCRACDGEGIQAHRLQ